MIGWKIMVMGQKPTDIKEGRASLNMAIGLFWNIWNWVKISLSSGERKPVCASICGVVFIANKLPSDFGAAATSSRFTALLFERRM